MVSNKRHKAKKIYKSVQQQSLKKRRSECGVITKERKNTLKKGRKKMPAERIERT